MTEERRRRPDARLAAEAGRHLGYGLTWALSTVLFLALGWLVDRWLGTMPLFTIVGAFVGAGAGFYNLYYHLVVEPRRRGGPEESKESEDSEESEEEER